MQGGSLCCTLLIAACKDSTAHSCRTQGERSDNGVGISACEPSDMPAGEEHAHRSRTHRPRVLADALPPAGRAPLRGASLGRPSRVPAAQGPLSGPLHSHRPLVHRGASRGIDWAGPVGRRGAPLGASAEARRGGASSPPARRWLAPVEGARWPVAVILQRLMMHGACNAEGTLLSSGTSLQHANVNSESATTLLHTSDSLVVSEMQRMHGRHDCRHQQPSSVGLQLSNTPPQPLRELHRAQARANNLRILCDGQRASYGPGPLLGKKAREGAYSAGLKLFCNLQDPCKQSR